MPNAVRIISSLPKIYNNSRGRLAVAIVMLVILQALAMGGSAYATRQIFGSLHGNVAQNITAFAFGILALSAVIFALGRIFSMRFSEKLGQSYAIEFRRNFYSHLAMLPKSSLSKKRVGALSIRFVGDLGAMRDWVSKGIVGIISACIIVPAAMYVLWLLYPLFMTVGFAALFVSVIAMTYIGKAHSSIQACIRRERANISIDMMERVAIAPDLRLLGRLKTDFRLLERRGKDLSDAAVNRTKRVETLRAAPDVIFAFAGVSMLWVTVSQGLQAGTAAAGLAVLSIITLYIRDLANVWDMWCAWEIARDKSQIIFDIETILSPSGTQNLPNLPVSVSLNKVSTEHLTEVSFKIESGAKVMVYGDPDAVANFIDVLVGYEKLSEGVIELSGINYHDIKQRSLSKRIQILDLDSPILQGSLRRALTMGCMKRPRDEKIVKAINDYGLTSLVERLGGLGGRVDEAGRNLSPWEHVRVLLARTYLSNPKLLIVNLPVQAFEADTQNLIKALAAWQDATVLLLNTAMSESAFITHTLNLTNTSATLQDIKTIDARGA